ncbi:SDR family oxidoreductase [Apilactobacillus timberlakei]|uniref:SDR family oxidoreductase n=1 Tax=Apilactobacillus timberlakei TaxID=2008380 RepID=UPI00112DCD62|nr:SDR family oxidoreductase [Apilactobacillus timberlakei]TPR19143.1 SDR family NAD(P)-dependent oxidoreductase [Apilactobacillus timberlakei]
MKYAITMVTGKFGRAAINYLMNLVDHKDIIALARNVDKAKEELPEDIEVRPGDYTNKDQLVESLKDVDKLLFISSQPGGEVSRLQQHKNVVTAAKKADVKYIAYTSFPHADKADNFLSKDHTATELYIKEMGIDRSFLRNNWYLENELATLKAANNGGTFVYAADNGKVGWALEKEYAEGAVKVLTMDQPKEIYEFAGQSRSYADLANALKKVAANNFETKNVSLDEYEDGMKKAGLPDAVAKVVTNIQALIKAGELQEDTDDLENVLGHPLTSIKSALKETLQ